MSILVDSSTPSWHLKLNRSEEHFRDLELEVARYAYRKPFVTEAVKPDRKRGRFAFRIRFIEQPDPSILLILGDTLHNARSALDHLATGLVPARRRDKACFPVQLRDLWEINVNGDFEVADAEAREAFERCVREMDPEAVARIIEMQPFRYGAEAPTEAMGILVRLENADKHRKFPTLAVGLQDPDVVIRARGQMVAMQATGFRHDGTEIANFDWPVFDPPIQVDEVPVETPRLVCASVVAICD